MKYGVEGEVELDVVALIEQMEIHDGEDEVVWGPVANGQYSLAETYEFMHKKKPV